MRACPERRRLERLAAWKAELAATVRALDELALAISAQHQPASLVTIDGAIADLEHKLEHLDHEADRLGLPKGVAQ